MNINTLRHVTDSDIFFAQRTLFVATDLEVDGLFSRTVPDPVHMTCTHMCVLGKLIDTVE